MRSMSVQGFQLGQQFGAFGSRRRGRTCSGGLCCAGRFLCGDIAVCADCRAERLACIFAYRRGFPIVCRFKALVINIKW